MIRTGNVEVLLESFSISDDTEVTVIPVNCPGKGRVTNFVVDDEGRPTCVFKGKKCPYFKSVRFSEEYYQKTLVCRAQ